MISSPHRTCFALFHKVNIDEHFMRAMRNSYKMYIFNIKRWSIGSLFSLFAPCLTKFAPLFSHHKRMLYSAEWFMQMSNSCRCWTCAASAEATAAAFASAAVVVDRIWVVVDFVRIEFYAHHIFDGLNISFAKHIFACTFYETPINMLIFGEPWKNTAAFNISYHWMQ